MPFNARVNIWLKKGIYILPKNRCCKVHLYNGIFKENVTIIEEKDHSLMNLNDICLIVYEWTH